MAALCFHYFPRAYAFKRALLAEAIASNLPSLLQDWLTLVRHEHANARAVRKIPRLVLDCGPGPAIVMGVDEMDGAVLSALARHRRRVFVAVSTLGA